MLSPKSATKTAETHSDTTHSGITQSKSCMRSPLTLAPIKARKIRLKNHKDSPSTRTWTARRHPFTVRYGKKTISR